MGLNMAGQLQQHSAADSARKGRNRAKLRNFEEANRQYKREVMLDNAEWKNDVQVQDIEQDQVYQAMVNQWTDQDQQLDELFAKGDQKIEQAIIEMYESDYAGTQTGRTAGRLAGKSAKKLGMLKSRELHSMMMAKDTVQLRKDSIRDESQSKSWNLYENIRFAPIHGHTPMAPSLEAAPSKAGLILGLASSAVGGIQDYKAAKAPKTGLDGKTGGGTGGGTGGDTSGGVSTSNNVDSSPTSADLVSAYSGITAGTRIDTSHLISTDF